MKIKNIAIAAAIAVAPIVASAGTIIAVSTTPATSTLPVGGSVTVKHEFTIKYFNNEKFPCHATLTLADGTKESLMIQAPTAAITRTRTYTQPGTYNVDLTGVKQGDVVGCLGSQTSTAVVKSLAPVRKH